MTTDNTGDVSEGTLQGNMYIKSMNSSYSSVQVSQYLVRIGYTPKQQTEAKVIEDGLFDTSVENLERLMRLHFLMFPYENTCLFYSQDSPLTQIDPQWLYRRLMYERKGSHCAGQSTFFLHILRRLGYRAYQVGSRINGGETSNPEYYRAICHVVILAQPIPDSAETYLVDIGQRKGLTQPILLSTSDKNVRFGATVDHECRLRRRADPRSSLEGFGNSNNHLVWVLEMRDVKLNTIWTPYYTFSEEEFYDRDIANLCVIAQLHIDGEPFMHKPVVVKYSLLSKEGNPILDTHRAAVELARTDILQCEFGRVTLIDKELKLTYGATSKLVALLNTERERVKVLREVFGIMIKDDEMQHIKGLPCALPLDTQDDEGEAHILDEYWALARL